VAADPVTDDRLLKPHPLRSIFSSAPKTTPAANLIREISLHQAAEDIGPKPSKATPKMANTGAKGFAAIMKARAAKMKDEFSKLADEMNGEFDAMEQLKDHGKDQLAQMKADNADLREALGLENDK
jgi:hypothetical protein